MEEVEGVDDVKVGALADSEILDGDCDDVGSDGAEETGGDGLEEDSEATFGGLGGTSVIFSSAAPSPSALSTGT